MQPGCHFGEDFRGEGFFDFFVFRYFAGIAVLEEVVQAGFCPDDIDIRILGNRYRGGPGNGTGFCGWSYSRPEI